MYEEDKECVFHEKAKSCNHLRKGTYFCDNPLWDEGRRDYCELLSDCYCCAAPVPLEQGECFAKGLNGLCILSKYERCFVY